MSCFYSPHYPNQTDNETKNIIANHILAHGNEGRTANVPYLHKIGAGTVGGRCITKDEAERLLFGITNDRGRLIRGSCLTNHDCNYIMMPQGYENLDKDNTLLFFPCQQNATHVTFGLIAQSAQVYVGVRAVLRAPCPDLVFNTSRPNDLCVVKEGLKCFNQHFLNVCKLTAADRIQDADLQSQTKSNKVLNEIREELGRTQQIKVFDVDHIPPGLIVRKVCFERNGSFTDLGRYHPPPLARPLMKKGCDALVAFGYQQGWFDLPINRSKVGCLYPACSDFDLSRSSCAACLVQAVRERFPHDAWDFEALLDKMMGKDGRVSREALQGALREALSKSSWEEWKAEWGLEVQQDRFIEGELPPPDR
mmetsp:Transcript_52307/g.136717  ORF Transcript_52307/g.136717 Transcript_52307/m.136717 type:complete len:365 (+) Transcript_52307:1020-2114(+)